MELSKYELIIIITALADYKKEIQDEKEEGIECVAHQEMLYPVEIGQYILEIDNLENKLIEEKNKKVKS